MSIFFSKYQRFFWFLDFWFPFGSVCSVTVPGINSIVLVSRLHINKKINLLNQWHSIFCYIPDSVSACFSLCEELVLLLFCPISCSGTLPSCFLVEFLALDFSSFKNCSWTFRSYNIQQSFPISWSTDRLGICHFSRRCWIWGIGPKPLLPTRSSSPPPSFEVLHFLHIRWPLAY